MKSLSKKIIAYITLMCTLFLGMYSVYAETSTPVVSVNNGQEATFVYTKNGSLTEKCLVGDSRDTNTYTQLENSITVQAGKSLTLPDSTVYLTTSLSELHSTTVPMYKNGHVLLANLNPKQFFTQDELDNIVNDLFSGQDFYEINSPELPVRGITLFTLPITQDCKFSYTLNINTNIEEGNEQYEQRIYKLTNGHFEDITDGFLNVLHLSPDNISISLNSDNGTNSLGENYLNYAGEQLALVTTHYIENGPEGWSFRVNNTSEFTFSLHNDSGRIAGSGGAGAGGSGVPSYDEPTGILVVEKVDENGNPVSGATFVIKDDNGTEIETFMTSESTSEFKLPEGHYILSETIVPEGYKNEEINMEFNISADNITALKIVNTKEEDKKPVGSVIVKHITEDGEILSDWEDVKRNEKQGVSYKTQVGSFDGYEFVKLDENYEPAEGSVVAGKTLEVVYIYKPIEEPVKEIEKPIENTKEPAKEEPKQEEKPVKQESNTKTTEPQKTEVTKAETVKTGDNTNIWIWSTLMLVSCVAGIITITVKKKG